MRTFDVDILMVPGWTGSGPNHWQTRWEGRLKTARRVQQDDWDQIDKEAWTKRLLEEIRMATRPVVLVAHSCGVAAVAHAAQELVDTKVIGAFLVAPASEAYTLSEPAIRSLAPYPRDPLPFPSQLVASRNDEYCTWDEAAELALCWGSALVDAGNVGHINSESGHGPWPEGAMRFGWFLKRIGPKLR